MKTLVLGDTHGRPYWKKIVAKENADRVIFIGDYFDSYDDYTAAEQMDNFKQIVEYKQSGQAEVIILVGNHDYTYMRGISERYSGYQHGAAPAIQQLLEDNKEHLQMCYNLGNFLFSHAGVSHDWLLLHSSEYRKDENADVSEIVNDLFKYKPYSFCFAGVDPYGNSSLASPIWIRPQALQATNRETLRDKYIQVVGHTQVNKMDVEAKATGGRYHYIDALGTSGEYMIIEDDKLTFPVYKKEE
jgi:hypothetical protein